MKLKIYSQFDSELCSKWIELESNATITVFQTYYFQKISIASRTSNIKEYILNLILGIKNPNIM